MRFNVINIVFNAAIHSFDAVCLTTKRKIPSKSIWTHTYSIWKPTIQSCYFVVVCSPGTSIHKRMRQSLHFVALCFLKSHSFNRNFNVSTSNERQIRVWLDFQMLFSFAPSFWTHKSASTSATKLRSRP